LNPLLVPFVLAGAVLGISNPDSVRTYDGSAGQISVSTPKIDAEIDVDGRLDEAAWAEAALLQGFTQYDPVEFVPATQPTEALIFLSDDAIHIGIRAFDDQPGGIRTSISQRDEIVRKDDWIRIVLDTFQDQRRAYVFTVNPQGIQQDGVWFEGRQGGRGGGFGPPVDYNPDFLWQSYGRLESWGYTLEIRIPLKSIRFESRPVQSWGLNIVRRLERSGYESSWAPISSDQVNQLSQSGTLDGLLDLDPGMFLEFNPVLTSSVTGELDDFDVFDRGSPLTDFGFNLTYGLTSNLTLDGTYNPDFSQVEADAGQIAVNERFALFFPEQRPFFLEGTEIFNLPKRLIYTRSVANPITGAKLTGKVGDFGMGYLGAIDELNDSTNVYVNLLRLRRDVGAGSNVGLVYTDRTHSSAEYNRLLGGDGRFVAGRYALTVTGALSTTGELDDPTTSGGLWSARFERSGRGLTFNAEAEGVTPDFDAGSGFINRVDIAQFESRIGYTWFGGRGALLERYGPFAQVNAIWEHEDLWAGQVWEEGEMELGFSASFRGNITLFGNYFRKGFDLAPDRYTGLFTQTAGGLVPFTPDQGEFQGMSGLRLFMFANRWQRVRVRGSAERRTTPIFERGTGSPAERATSWNTDLNFTIFPTNSMQIEAGARHQTLSRLNNGEEYSSATLPRVSAQYQLSRSLFVRLIGEYAAQSRNDLRSPQGLPLFECEEGEECALLEGSDNNDVYFEALLSYEPSPGTVFFAGYSREMDDPTAFGFRQVLTQRDGFFMKISYRYRF